MSRVRTNRLMRHPRPSNEPSINSCRDLSVAGTESHAWMMLLNSCHRLPFIFAITSSVWFGWSRGELSRTIACWKASYWQGKPPRGDTQTQIFFCSLFSARRAPIGNMSALLNTPDLRRLSDRNIRTKFSLNRSLSHSYGTLGSSTHPIASLFFRLCGRGRFSVSSHCTALIR